jgi:nucleoside 2-deoxyribosyltransferase
MKIFCSYAYTGEDSGQVTERMRLVVDVLNQAGHVPYCDRFDPTLANAQTQNDVKTIFDKDFKRIAEADVVIVIITSPRRSVGQMIEVGAALSQKKTVYLFEHASAKDSTYLPKLVDKYFSWESNDDLEEALQNI